MSSTSSEPTSPTVYRADYHPLAYTVTQVDLSFILDPVCTVVKSRLMCQRNDAVTIAPLVLFGEDLLCLEIRVDGVVHPIPEDLSRVEIDLAQRAQAVVEITTQLSPQDNSELMGLFMSRGSFFTQCEAEGFRRITLFPDRPDVMARYTVRLEADAQAYPVLLSNGNLTAHGTLPGGRHYACWEDPFPKPSYLFALVAGQLERVEQRIQTRSGREVLLQVWVEAADLPRTAHAMKALVDALRWDENVFGLELDLDRFMVVAVSDFNAGAMENKGLNIFNTKYVLAHPDSATDDDFEAVESVVAHEYFHNWTGNRVTCRDWFQLTLKEGLTVFRDQQFTADMLAQAAGASAAESARAVKRIDDVDALRASQFTEDAGPMAHPIRPESYEEISNFYTATVYEKGAEVIRMFHTLLGEEGFRSGIDLYFSYFDGQAVTCDDFVDAMAEANGRDFEQFRRWYGQAGTPRVKIHEAWDAAQGTYHLTLTQRTPPTPGQAEKLPLEIPFAMGLIGPDGQDIPLQLKDEREGQGTTRVLTLKGETQTWTFVGLQSKPVLSALRGFSAPVVLELDERDEDLAFRMAHDSDPFNRREAAQRYAQRIILAIAKAALSGQTLAVPQSYIEAVSALLRDPHLDAGFRARVLELPGETYLLEQMHPAEPQALRKALMQVYQTLGQALEAEWLDTYTKHAVPGPYRYHPADAGRRALRNIALEYLCATGSAPGVAHAREQFALAENMTERRGALAALVHSPVPHAADEALAAFYQRYQNDALPLDKWFAIQATAWRWYPGAPDVLETVKKLVQHPAFQLNNPNKVYAVLGSFFRANPAEFHREDGAGYAFWAEMVLALDQRNAQIGSRMARALENWRRYPARLQKRIEPHLTALAQAPHLSNDVREIVTKALAD